MNKIVFESKGSQLTVTRTFAANIDLVWRAWTEADLLDQWWAPRPWKSRTKHMAFEENGTRLYAMCGPNGEEHWGITTYRTIEEHSHFSGEDAFCDSNGAVNEAMPVATFENHFHPTLDSTTVTVVTQYASEEHLRQVIQMGMKEGLSMAFENLDEVLNRLSQQE